MNSQVTNVIVIVMYYASALDLATTFCFLLFQDIKLPQTRTRYPKVEHLSLGDPTKSMSEYLTI